jgi:hypothetical protein
LRVSYSSVFEKKYESDIYSITNGAAEIDRKRDIMYVYELKENRVTPQSTTTGTKEPPFDGPATKKESPGFIYVDHQDMFYLWNSSRDMWKLNPVSKTWT